jgi:CHASE2 domain-containing sensor protein
VDIVIEILLEIYMELMLLIVPEKRVTKGVKTLAKILAVLMLLVVFGLVILGAILLFDYQNPWGWLPLIAAIVISVAQIVAGIIFYKRHH